MQCPFCDREYISKYYFDRHIKTMHKNAKESSVEGRNPKKEHHQCTECGKGFELEWQFRIHTNSHLMHNDSKTRYATFYFF